ncbi:MAG: hypothetical protein BWK76_19770 [Desulfobulbaceae bacterium A2]|nr:MAG: hypothetical protein BWK76_19770 [Desulfobulbaceae bacterium A2]
MYMKYRWGLCVSLCFLLCWQSLAAGAETLRLSMLPNTSPEELQRRLLPLANLLSAKTGMQVEPYIVTDFTDYEKKLAEGSFDISYANPVVFVKQSRLHEPLAIRSKGDEGQHFQGLIIVRSDSPITDLAGLRGKKVMATGRTSAYGFLSQKLSLLEQGITPEQDLRLEEAVDNKIENVILAVYMGEADAGFITESGRNRIDRYVPAAMIKVLATTAPLPGWVLSVRRSLPANVKEKLQQAVLALKPGDPVLSAMDIKVFRTPSILEFEGLRRAMGLSGD